MREPPTGRRRTTGAPSTAERRQRAFTLFANAYDQCRRAATYLRWNEGDADELVASLHGGRTRRPDEATRRRTASRRRPPRIPFAREAPARRPGI